MKQFLLVLFVIAGFIWASNNDYQAQVEYQQGLSNMSEVLP